jgi:phosphomevalonate kinase
MNRSVSAPGKLFLCGEYAVLWGGTALLAAVGPRTAGMVRARSDRQVHLVTGAGRLRGDATPLGVRWEAPAPSPFRFAARAIDEALRAHGKECLGFEVVLEPPSHIAGGKPGFGGSAQVALLAVELSRSALHESFDPLKVALLAHSKAQGSAGSGADVATVFAGGLVRFRRYATEDLAAASARGQLSSALPRAPPVDIYRLPSPKVHLSYAYSGESSSTPELIARIEQGLAAPDRERIRSESDRLEHGMERALATGDFRTLSELVSKLEELLSSLGPVETDAIRRILAIARSYGACGKVSGAGGGDGCILFSPDADTNRELLAGLGERGYWVTPLTIEGGLRGEAEISAALRAQIS